MAYVIKHNNPSVGYISWQNLNMQYNGTSYPITDGNTNLTYTWWAINNPYVLQSSNTFPTLTAADALVLLNKNGTAVLVPGSTVLDGALIVPGSILADALSANSVTGKKILAGEIDTGHIKAGAITSTTIAADAVGAEAIAAGVIVADHIASDAITSDKIVADAITTDKIAANAVTANEIASNAVTADKISVSTLSAITANLGSITSGTITGATVRTSSGTSRIEMSSNLLRSYRNGVRRVQLDYDSLDFYTSDNRLGGEVVASVDSFSNLPVISVQSSDGMAFLESRKSSTNYAEIYASAYQGVDDDEALAGINVRRGSNEGNVEVGPGAVFINAAHGYDVTTLSVSGMDGVAVYGDFSVDGDIDKIKTGTCYLSTSWRSFSFGETLPSVPRMTLTSADGVSSISNGKVRNVTRTGFEAVLGGSGYSSSTHHYIAICGEG
jgi:hypothetical protein